MTRLPIPKTLKLYIDGKFPRSESGRSWPISTAGGDYHLCLASRKDLRDAVEAARRAQPGWTAATAYNRGQVLYRMAEMMEGKRDEFAACHGPCSEGPWSGKTRTSKARSVPRTNKPDEAARSIDRLVHYAGWADKYSQVLGCNNPVSGPFYNFTIAEPTGVVAVLAPDEFPLLALVSLLAPALCAGNTVVAITGDTNPIPAAVLGEVAATSDVPAGVLNILTGRRAELLPFIAQHRDIDAIHAANLPPADAAALRAGAAENIKRVVHRERVNFLDDAQCHTPWWIEPLVEMKTIWHPSSV